VYEHFDEHRVKATEVKKEAAGESHVGREFSKASLIDMGKFRTSWLLAFAAFRRLFPLTRLVVPLVHGQDLYTGLKTLLQSAW